MIILPSLLSSRSFARLRMPIAKITLREEVECENFVYSINVVTNVGNGMQKLFVNRINAALSQKIHCIPCSSFCTQKFSYACRHCMTFLLLRPHPRISVCLRDVCIWFTNAPCNFGAHWIIPTKAEISFASSQLSRLRESAQKKTSSLYQTALLLMSLPLI